MASKRSLSLNEILSLLEDGEIETSQLEHEVFLLPPENANADLTYEDSGDEDQLNVSNLPPSLLRTEAELRKPADSFDDIENEPESEEPVRKVVKKYNWRKREYESIESSWPPDYHISQEKSPLEWWSLFFSEEIIDLLTTETNKYLGRKNLAADIKIEEMKTIIGILLVSGYSSVNRRRMYWENSPDLRNELIVSSLSRDIFSYIFSNLHCADNQLDSSHKFAKARPLMNNVCRVP